MDFGELGLVSPRGLGCAAVLRNNPSPKRCAEQACKSVPALVLGVCFDNLAHHSTFGGAPLSSHRKPLHVIEMTF